MNIFVYNKKTFEPWKEKLDTFFRTFTASQDKLASNYDIDYDELDEITLITNESEIIAFSSVLKREGWPNNSRRILNRFIRNKDLNWQDNTFGTLSKIMHDAQIEYCKKQDVDFVFVSIQGKKKNYLKRWTQQANVHSSGWVQPDGMFRVCGGKPINCVQHLTYKNISGTDKEFEMLSEMITYEQYQNLL